MICAASNLLPLLLGQRCKKELLDAEPGNRRNTLWLVVVAQLVEPQIVVLVVRF